jgi:hypothetical protein
VHALERGAGGRRVWGRLEKRARWIAQECNGRLPELVAIAADPGGPKVITAVLALLEDRLAGPDVMGGRQKDPARRSLEQKLAGFEKAGMLEEAEEVRQALANLGA